MKILNRDRFFYPDTYWIQSLELIYIETGDSNIRT